jgi:hypothetical protein
MNRKLIFFVLIFIRGAFGQLSVSNLFEYQVGNLPDTEPSNLTTHYDQVNLSYRYNDLLFTGKLEHFKTNTHSESYDILAKRTLSFSKDGLDLSVGNFYQIFGRGILLRTYEMPGVLREEAGLRTRYGFYRDIDGFWARYRNSWLELTALRGRPLKENLPPTISNEIRRKNLLEGAQIQYYISDLTFTGAYLRNNNNNEFNEYTTFAIAANLPFDVQIYNEYARQLSGAEDFFDISDNSAHALYLSMNIIYGTAGLSAEFKDYNYFLLGFNDPPPLVKEHEYLLLNRSTHNLEPLNETGWQTEFFYSLSGGHTIVANISESVNESFFRRFIFKEKFVELSYHLSQEMTVKGFVDFGQEDFRLERDRHTYGIYAENEWPQRWGTTIDLEYQKFFRGMSDPEKVKNYALLFSVSYAPDFSIGLSWEHTTDSFESRRDWFGSNLSYQYSQHHLINMFYGKRRGGNSCSAGICYQILPFEGFEIRLVSTL